MALFRPSGIWFEKGARWRIVLISVDWVLWEDSPRERGGDGVWRAVLCGNTVFLLVLSCLKIMGSSQYFFLLRQYAASGNQSYCWVILPAYWGYALLSFTWIEAYCPINKVAKREGGEAQGEAVKKRE
jgi:hypothetical protein